MKRKKFVKNLWSFIFTFCMLSMSVGGYFNFKVSANEPGYKLSIGDQLCIDTTCETPITEFENSDFSVYKSNYDNSYNLDIKTSSNIGKIEAQGNINLIVHLNKESTVSSIENIHNLAILGNDSSNILNVDDNININGLLILNGNLKATKIENSNKIIINNSELSINSKNNAFENIKEGILTYGNSKLKISSNDLNTNIYSIYANPKENNILNYDSLFKEEITNWNLDNEKYKTSEILNNDNTHTWILNSKAPKLRKFVYGKNIFSENLDNKDNIQVLTATGVKLDNNTYGIIPGSIVKIKIDSNSEKTLNKDFVNSISLKNTENENEFEFTMPDQDLYLNDIFNENIKNASLQNTFDGNETSGSTNENSGDTTKIREIKTTVNYNEETLKVLVRDPNNVLTDDATLDVKLIDSTIDSELYSKYYDKLDNKYKNNTNTKKRAFFEITVWKDNKREEKYSQLDKKVQILFQIPKGWNKDTIQSVLILDEEDDGFDEETTTIEGTDYVSFFTDHFSPYTLSYDDYKSIYGDIDSGDIDSNKEIDIDKNDNLNNLSAAIDDNSDNDTSSSSTYKTGDLTSKIIIYTAISLTIASLIEIIVIKNKKKQHV